MKKVMFLLAVAGMFAFAACNNTPAEEEVIDSTVEEMVEEEISPVDSLVDSVINAAEEVVVE